MSSHPAWEAPPGGEVSDAARAADGDAFDCRACGACCAHSSDWPRFSTETEAEIDRIPAAMIAEDLSGMRCEGARCAALSGEVGRRTGCTIYAVRPVVCRTCLPGDAECLIARAARFPAGGPPEAWHRSPAD